MGGRSNSSFPPEAADALILKGGRILAQDIGFVLSFEVKDSGSFETVLMENHPYGYQLPSPRRRAL